jgi:hypothetical protein
VTRAIRDSDDVLVCRLVKGKVTFVHRRMWPALVRVAGRLPSDRLSQVREVHTKSGRHVTKITFPISPTWRAGPASLKALAKFAAWVE